MTSPCPFGLRPDSFAGAELVCLRCTVPAGCVYEPASDPPVLVDWFDVASPDLAARVLGLRKSLGISQREVARRAGVSGSFVSTIERAVRGVRRLSYVAALAMALQVPLRDLLAPARYLALPPEWPPPSPVSTSGQPGNRARGSLGKRVRGLRKSLGLTQLSLARRAGLSQAMVSLVERGRRTYPRGRSLVPLAAALGVSAVDLLLDADYLEPGPPLAIGDEGEC